MPPSLAVLFILDVSRHTERSDVLGLYNYLVQVESVAVFHASHVQPGLGNGLIDCQPITTPLTFQEFAKLDSEPTESFQINSFELVCTRIADPFPSTLFKDLSYYEESVQFLSRPSSCLKALGKRFLHETAGEFMPPSAYVESVSDAIKFASAHERFVAKSEDSSGGLGVYRVTKVRDQVESDNRIHGQEFFSSLESLFEVLLSRSEGLLLTRYLENVAEGDKRVLVVDGEIYGGYVRRSETGWLQNLAAGGTAEPGAVSERERSAILATYPHYSDLGLYVLGYDFLMDDDRSWVLSEVNYANAGGIGRLQELTGEPFYQRFAEWLVMKAKARYFLSNA